MSTASAQPAGGGSHADGVLDPVTFEVIRNTLVTICDEMGVRLCRTAFSPVITEGRDFTFALFDPDGLLVASGHWDMPFHFGTFEGSLAEVLREFAGDIHEKDVFLFNDPYTGGTHNNDMRAIRPAFHEGELIGWLVVCGHWTDAGGPLPGTLNPSARDCFAEGIRVPPIRIIDRGRRVNSVVGLVLANVRGPAAANGDLQAMLGCLEAGDERMGELAERYGRDTLLQAYKEIWDYSERVLRAATAELPNGVYEWVNHIDRDPGTDLDDPVAVRLALEVRDGDLIFDFTGSDRAPKGAVGSTLPTTLSGVLTATLNVFTGVPLSHGVDRVIEVRTTPGSVVHLLPPSPSSGAAAGAYEKIVATSLGCIGKASPERRTACIFNLINVTLGGVNERFDRPWVMYFWLPGGYGATALGDSTLPSHMLFGPGVRIQPIEVHERFFPVVFEELALSEDSAGAGRFRGGWGVRCSFRLTGEEAVMSVLGDRGKFPPWGVEGGSAGAHQTVTIDPGSPAERPVGMFAAGVPVKRGSRVVYVSGGGGGFGDARERDPELVVSDANEGLLGPDHALDAYGVVIRGTGDPDRPYELDAAATAAARRASAPDTDMKEMR